MKLPLIEPTSYGQHENDDVTLKAPKPADEIFLHYLVSPTLSKT